MADRTFRGYQPDQFTGKDTQCCCPARRSSWCGGIEADDARWPERGSREEATGPDIARPRAVPKPCFWERPTQQSTENVGAGEGNRTLVISLEGCCSTIELHPHRDSIRQTICKSQRRTQKDA